MKFLDEAKIHLKAGDGGAAAVLEDAGELLVVAAVDPAAAELGQVADGVVEKGGWVGGPV